MNKFIRTLYEMGLKESRLIIGLMSGTSLDGLDIALCRVHGSGISSQVELLEFETVPYQEVFKSDIRAVFSKEQVSLEKLTLLNALIAERHAGYINQALEKWRFRASEVDCIASHGQTIYHAPKRLHPLESYPNATLQIGDGDHIAVKTGIITLSDFRQKHIAAGGEGAPLALYGDCILFSSEAENRILLNIGGISNFTFLPREKERRVVSTDAGPGNTLIDALTKRDFGLPFDEAGNLARSGKLHAQLLSTLLTNDFFTATLPKSTGPELFNLDYIDRALCSSGLYDISPYDLLNTITHFTAAGIAGAINDVLVGDNAVLYVSGGGAHNNYLVELLQGLLPDCQVKKTEDLGINPDAKEAVLFTLLANETICGSALDTGAGPAVMMGKISLPL